MDERLLREDFGIAQKMEKVVSKRLKQMEAEGLPGDSSVLVN